MVCSLNTALKVSTAHISALSLAEPVVHKTVAEANSLLGFCEHHLCDCAWVSLCWCGRQSCACEGWVGLSEICPAMSYSRRPTKKFIFTPRVLCKRAFPRLRCSATKHPDAFHETNQYRPRCPAASSCKQEQRQHLLRACEHPTNPTQRQEDRHQLPPRAPRTE